ncbi:MAG: hypothetical protein AABZ16_03030, partial [candidate division NC10 bacterium]
MSISGPARDVKGPVWWASPDSARDDNDRVGARADAVADGTRRDRAERKFSSWVLLGAAPEQSLSVRVWDRPWGRL